MLKPSKDQAPPKGQIDDEVKVLDKYMAETKTGKKTGKTKAASPRHAPQRSNAEITSE